MVALLDGSTAHSSYRYLIGCIKVMEKLLSMMNVGGNGGHNTWAQHQYQS